LYARKRAKRRTLSASGAFDQDPRRIFTDRASTPGRGRAIPHYRQVLAIDPGRQDVKTALAEVERQLALQLQLRR
jgi:hypothetical protein